METFSWTYIALSVFAWTVLLFVNTIQTHDNVDQVEFCGSCYHSELISFISLQQWIDWNIYIGFFLSLLRPINDVAIELGPYLFGVWIYPVLGFNYVLVEFYKLLVYPLSTILGVVLLMSSTSPDEDCRATLAMAVIVMALMLFASIERFALLLQKE